jgi:hypothetical protein
MVIRSAATLLEIRETPVVFVTKPEVNSQCRLLWLLFTDESLK